ncbi:unnamed protein product [Dovyalis caffra]|uniref:TF-B3 domain-containing protein n=1 Tax=Dovyalis caffra TaxID=77055 RepID=A0AAV1SC17_9ROSI|nr:unnamed protein product [Dovyalis caffra]
MVLVCNQEGNFGSVGSDSAEEETEDDDSSFQLMEGVSPDSKETSSSSLDFHPRKPAGTDSAKAANGTRFSGMNREGIKGKAKLGSSSKEYEGFLPRNQPSAADGNAEALDRNGVPNDIPCFTIQMLDSHLPPRSTLSVPSWFAIKYLKEEEGDITLSVLNEGSWRAKYRVCKASRGSRVRLKEGWGRFALKNGLEVGDICSFYLLKRDKVVFQVSISRPDKK